MSREIKFRLHCGDTGEVLAYEKFNTSLNWGYYWYDAKLPKDDAICETSNYFRHKNPLGKIIRVEFTGLTDSNGVEIYEGDIVEYFSDFTEDKTNHQVKYFGHDDYPAFDFSPSISDDMNGFSALVYQEIGTVKVIGNIYQNPELLK